MPNPKQNEISRRWRKAQPERALNAYYKYKYGITWEQYKQMLADQNGLCALCEKTDGAGRRLSVDHDHDTGFIRGLLCVNCNAAIGGFGESVQLLQKAIEYIHRADLLQKKGGL